MSRTIASSTGKFLTDPDGGLLSGTLRFVLEGNTLNSPAQTIGEIVVTSGEYSGSIAVGVYTINFIQYADTYRLGTSTAINDGAAIDVLTLVGIDDVPTSAADLILTDMEAAAAQTAADAAATAADRVQTGLDAIATDADAVATAADVIATAADAVATAADVIATAADRVQTGFDAAAAATSESNAAASAAAAAGVVTAHNEAADAHNLADSVYRAAAIDAQMTTLGVAMSFDMSQPEGGWIILSPSYMYTDTAGTTNVTAQDDVVGNITDNSGNSNTLVAVSDAARALAKTDGTNWWIQLDKVDDNYSTTFANPIVGTMLIGTRKGTIHIEVNIPAGAWSLTQTPAYFPGNTVTDIILKNGYMTAAELANAKAWLASRGSPLVYTPTGTDLANAFRFWGTLTSVTQGADLSNVTSFAYTFQYNQITSIPTGLFDNTPNVTSFSSTFYTNQITSIPTGLFDNTPNVTSFAYTFYTNQITSIPTGLFDNTPNVTSFTYTFNANQITSIPTGLFDNTPNVTSFNATFTNNGTLTTAPAGLFDSQTVCTNYTSCFTNTNLTQTSIDNVLASIRTSYAANGLTGGTFNQSGGSAPSAAGEADIDYLRAQGMTVTVKGGY